MKDFHNLGEKLDMTQYVILSVYCFSHGSLYLLYMAYARIGLYISIHQDINIRQFHIPT